MQQRLHVARKATCRKVVLTQAESKRKSFPHTPSVGGEQMGGLRGHQLQQGSEEGPPTGGGAQAEEQDLRLLFTMRSYSMDYATDS